MPDRLGSKNSVETFPKNQNMKFKFIFLANNVSCRLPEVLADELVSLDPDLDECPSSEFVENDTDLLRRFMTIFLYFSKLYDGLNHFTNISHFSAIV